MQQNKVYTVKLISGEEIISRVNQKDGTTELVKPRLVAMMPQGFGMTPWMLSAPDTNVIISDNMIVGAAETSDMVSKEYIKQTTGLAI